jgi:hypothetical protein
VTLEITKEINSLIETVVIHAKMLSGSMTPFLTRCMSGSMTLCNSCDSQVTDAFVGQLLVGIVKLPGCGDAWHYLRSGDVDIKCHESGTDMAAEVRHLCSAPSVDTCHVLCIVHCAAFLLKTLYAHMLPQAKRMIAPDSRARPSAAELLCTSAFQLQESSPSFSPLLGQPGSFKGRLFEEPMEETMEEVDQSL